MSTDSLMAHWAGEYLKLGLKVIALSGKTPNGRIHPHWRDDYLEGAPESDADWDVIRHAFHHPDTTGVGIVIEYPYVVVDVDGEEGANQWSELFGGEVEDWALHADLTWTAKTGRGLHIWYGCLTPTGTIKLGSKLDLKAQGGYVAAPPSRHPDGATYEWVIPPSAEAPPIEAPQPLARRIEKHVYNLASSMDAKAVRKRAWGPKWTPGATKFYAQAGFDPLLEGMKTAEDGNRNNYLHWAAATLAEEGASDEFFEELSRIALEVGLDRVEVKRTIRSARQSHG